MPKYRSDVRKGVVAVVQPDDVPESTEDKLGTGEVRVACPKCGSPHVASFAADEPRHGADLPDFECQAGDCGFAGATRR